MLFDRPLYKQPAVRNIQVSIVHHNRTPCKLSGKSRNRTLLSSQASPTDSVIMFNARESSLRNGDLAHGIPASLYIIIYVYKYKRICVLVSTCRAWEISSYFARPITSWHFLFPVPLSFSIPHSPLSVSLSSKINIIQPLKAKLYFSVCNPHAPTFVVTRKTRCYFFACINTQRLRDHETIGSMVSPISSHHFSLWYFTFTS